jgi:hypothetical protein
MPQIRVDITRTSFRRATITSELDEEEMPNTAILAAKANQIARGLLAQAQASPQMFEEEHDYLVEIQGVYLLRGDWTIEIPLDPKLLPEPSFEASYRILAPAAYGRSAEPSESIAVKCQACGAIYADPSEADGFQIYPNIPDLGIRTSPGEIIPYCECKECGALCHLLE